MKPNRWLVPALAMLLCACSESSPAPGDGPPAPDGPIDRGSLGQPPLQGDAVAIDGRPFFPNLVQVEAARPVLRSELQQLEAIVGAVTCGASPFSDVLFLCLDSPAATSEELMQAIVRAEAPAWVTGVGPVSAQLSMVSNGDLPVSCDKTKGKHLTRLGADAAAHILADHGGVSSAPSLFVADVGFHWHHESLTDAWVGQPLDYGGADQPPASWDNLCPNGIPPAGAADCDVYFHDPKDIYGIDHGTTVASAAAGKGVGILPGLAVTPYKIGTDWLAKAPNGLTNKGGGAFPLRMCEGVEAAIAAGASVINLSFEVAAAPGPYANKPPNYCQLSWWKEQLATLNDRKGVLVITAGNSGKDLDVEADAQPLLDTPGTIVVGATWRDAPDRWDDMLFGFGSASGYRSQHPMVYAPGGDLCLAGHDPVGDWPDPASNTAYSLLSGTSFAAPQVAAIVAAIKGLKPFLSAAEIEVLLLQTGGVVKDGKHDDSREARFDQAVLAALLLCDPAAACGTTDATRCSGSVLQSCTLDTTGCAVWQNGQDCAASGQECTEEAGAAVCTGADAGPGDSGPDDDAAPDAGAADAGDTDAGDAGADVSAESGTDADAAGLDGGMVYGTGYSCTGGLLCGTSSCCDYQSINGANFGMGRSSSGADTCPAAMTCDASEQPEHAVVVIQQYMDVFEVSVGRFRRFVETYDGTPPPEGQGEKIGLPGTGWQSAWNPYLPTSGLALASELNCDATMATWTASPGPNESRPINCVTWYEAMAFCLWEGASLPTEAQWEFASAAGTQNRTYPWGFPGAAIGPGQLSYACGGDGAPGCALTDISDVGTKPYGLAADGIHDLGGNVGEWTLDWFDAAYYSSASVGTVNLTPTGQRTVRGGSWTDILTRLRAASRVGAAPDSRSSLVGIRCTL